MKRKLYIFTDNFPYGQSEKSFLIPELDMLQENYNVTIVSAAGEKDRWNKELETIVDSSIKVFHHSSEEVIGIEVCRYIIPFLFFKGTKQELRDILRSRKDIFSRIQKALFFFARAKKFQKWIEQQKIIVENQEGIIYSYWYNHRVLSLSLMKGRYPYLKILTRAHGYDLYKERRQYSWQPYKTIMDRTLDKVVFISEHGLQYYLENYNIDKEQIGKYEVCRMGVRKQTITMCCQRHIPFLLVSCSSVISLKRVELIVDALAEVNDYQIEWIHFGNGRLFEEVKERAKIKLDNKKNIKYELKGYMNNDKILEYYTKRIPDGFITVSSTEGSPVSIQEALAFGIPIIGTAVGGIPEMIQGNGILLNANPTVDQIVNAIETLLLLDEERYLQMRKKSYQIWKRDYNQSNNMKKFLKILGNL